MRARLVPSALRSCTCRDEATGRAPFKDYSFNAYYRHKWTQKDLGLYRPRWYVEQLRKQLARNTPSGRLRIAQTIYVAVVMCRYVAAVLTYPLMIVRRWRVTCGAYLRMIRCRNALPDTLP